MSDAPGTIVERFRGARRDTSLVVLEGLHALKHALRFGARVFEIRAPDPDALHRLAAELAPDVADAIGALVRTVTPDTFAELAPSPPPTGVIALARRPVVALDELLESRARAPIVLLERPTHHGNIGAVVRVAAAADAAGVLVTGRHDPWHPASVRGAAGLQHALPVASLDRAGLDAVVASDRSLIALDPEGAPLRPGGPDAGPGLPSRAVLVFGSERTGVSPALLARAARRVSIPMRPGVSSLNLATAVAVTLYMMSGGPDGAASE